MAKNWGKFDNKVQKLPNFKEKKGLFKAKKQAGAELRNKKKDFEGQKFGKTLRIRSRN